MIGKNGVRSIYDDTYLVEVAWPGEGVRVVHHVGEWSAITEGRLFVVRFLKGQHSNFNRGVEEGAAGEHGQSS